MEQFFDLTFSVFLELKIKLDWFRLVFSSNVNMETNFKKAFLTKLKDDLEYFGQ